MSTSREPDKSNDTPGRPAANTVHPRVWAILIGLAAWFALAVWSFAGSGLTDYLLFIVSGFIFVVVALQLILSRVRRADDAAEKGGDPPPLRKWAGWDFETWQGKLSGAQAAVQILLPIAAAAVGMTAFGIVFHIAEHGRL
jgi:hypothetical protein